MAIPNVTIYEVALSDHTGISALNIPVSDGKKLFGLASLIFYNLIYSKRERLCKIIIVLRVKTPAECLTVM
jgi:hypothetical protein